VDVIERLNAAMNARDIDAFVENFHEDYDSEQPAHPDRAFVGSAQVRKNWSSIFEGVPDFSSELLGWTSPTARSCGASGAGAGPVSTWRA
jgi:hypothetical protein